MHTMCVIILVLHILVDFEDRQIKVQNMRNVLMGGINVSKYEIIKNICCVNS